MNLETLLVERSGGVALVTINRPEKRNALNSVVRRELVEVVETLAAEGEARVIVFTGAGDKAFVAGADIQEFAERSPLEQRDSMTRVRVFDAIASSPLPTIAMINGFALGGGCELAMACDIRIAADSARLGQPEINLGIIPGGGGTQRLPRLVGIGQAMRLVLSGDLIDAAEAARIGLVDQVFPADSLREQTLALAGRIAERSPATLKLAKDAIRASQEMPLSAGLRYETELFITCFSTEDKQEGVKAFFEKRPAEFRGR